MYLKHIGFEHAGEENRQHECYTHHYCYLN